MDDIFLIRNNFSKFSDVPSQLLVGNVADCPRPVVSVIMPCFKRVEHFRKALLSVVNQECNFEYEVIVLDNNADEAISPAQKIVEELNAKNVLYYKNEKNIGMMPNWNRGIELARAEYITYCHDDDILLPNSLSRLMELQKKHGNKCILSAYNYIDDNDNYISQRVSPQKNQKKLFHFFEKDCFSGSLFYLFYDNVWCGGGCLFNRKLMLKLGGYREDMSVADYALNIVYTYHYGAVINTIPTYNYRMGKSNASNTLWVNSVEQMDYCRACMINKMHLPKIYLDKLRKALFKKFTIQYNSVYGDGKTSPTPPLTRGEKILIKYGYLYVRKILSYF